MRIIFMGTPEFAVPALVALVEAGHEVVAAYTQPPRPGGRRGRELTPSPVQREAEVRGIAVRHPASLKGADEQAGLAALDADIAVVAAYGLILPQAVLDAPRLGCLNIHASILPRWRGAAPIQRAIMAGDPTTGVTIMQMEAGLDTGPMLATLRTTIDRKTAGELTQELAERGAQLLVGTLRDLKSHRAVRQPEDGVTYAKKIDKAEARLYFTASAEQVERQVRAFAPAPGAFFELDGERYKVLAAEVVEGAGKPGTVIDDALTIACGSGAVRPVTVQRAGRPAMATAELLRGRPVAVGTVL
ncbi:methionyl-tRNA formyltransferase [Novosphingobium chloroacetimidivorans]|uniref:Methionyl-tRNA formyltransferase n=1 Tax=Novosphingobium chloroacetimidivorans TaxID=1428314 RepID=A0A7W7KB48_9SPHN|nr:methionyl-tRNA formyltransferase [Novosphingobium chloroacetimidivorans]MBB4859029.1 methionyl-tRNA formyltransferase [Novosphingobium chloroacetimidivorans]